MEAVESTIREFIKSNFFSTEAFSDEDSLFDKGIVDSTGVLEVVNFIEEKFDFKVKDDEMAPENFESVAKLAAYVRRRTAAAGGAQAVG